MFKPNKKEKQPNGSEEPKLTEEQRRALEKQQEQARILRRLEAEADLLGRRT